MAMRFAPQLFTFESPGQQSGHAEFGNTVRSSGGCIQGFKTTFGSKDHHLRDLEIQVSNVTPQGTGVSYDVSFKLKDNDNNSGSADINVLIIADVEA